MSRILAVKDQHPFVGLDVAWLVEMRAQTRRDHPFLVWAPFSGADQTWTYGQFHDRVGRIASGLGKRGVKPGDRILIHLDNCPEALLAWYACARIGAVAVTTNARAVADELAYYVSTAARWRALPNRNLPSWWPKAARVCAGWL